MSYNIKPYSTKNADLAVILNDGVIILRVITGKGESFLKEIDNVRPITDDSLISFIGSKHEETEARLLQSNNGLPDYQTTGVLIKGSGEDIWKKYSSTCVSCGACTTICPTCTCFLLIDKPGFA